MEVAAIILFPAVAYAQDQGKAQRGAGDGPGPAANGPGPGCNLIPPLASTGTKVAISQFPPADSLTDPELAAPGRLLKSAKFYIPIAALPSVHVPSCTPPPTLTL